MIKGVGKGSHGHVFMALHVPTMKLFAVSILMQKTNLSTNKNPFSWLHKILFLGSRLRESNAVRLRRIAL